MLSGFRFLAICFFLVTARAASNVNITEILAETPSCALGCFAMALASAPTLLTDPASACVNVTLQSSLSNCLQVKCNFTELERIQLCSGVPVESRVWTFVTVILISGTSALVAVTLRIYSRCTIAQSLGADDWTVVVAAAILITSIVLLVLDGLTNGIGRHIWDVSPSLLVPALKVFYVLDILYITLVNLIKVSILLFYLRVFPNAWFRTADLITLAVVVTSWIAIIIPTIFQCNPIILTCTGGIWNFSLQAECLNLHAFAYTTGGLFIALDIVILILPIPCLVKLKMDRKKKINVMFSIACITSIVRLHFIVRFANSSDPTWDDVDTAIWSTLEFSVAMVCACLPAIRALFSRWLPSVFGSTNIASSNGRDKSDPGQPSESVDISHRLRRLQKIGPSYNKRVVTPDDELLCDTPQNRAFGDRHRDRHRRQHGKERQEAKVWINPRFDPEGNVVEWQGPVEIERHISYPSTEDTSLWLLEGPMIGDVEVGQVGIVGKARSIEMGNIGIAVNSAEELARAEYRSGRPRLQRIWASKSLPPLPTGGRPGNWV
ncbi:hypothetical protein N431DRAFT_499610 [Stipitochalara longipes BDJ]|nr:hypothetical protein N431DRAFT_499610 [Stipitochalara longipes BDJ]